MIVISCSPLLLMLLLQLVACSSWADHFRRHQSLRGGGFGSIHRDASLKFVEGQKVEGKKALNEEKRMVFTGPNPLHNK